MSDYNDTLAMAWYANTIAAKLQQRFSSEARVLTFLVLHSMML
jgi:hypothetical protein